MEARVPFLETKIAIPQNDLGEPVFGAPWESRAFAIALTLFEQEQSSWNEFRDGLRHEIDHHSRPDQPDNYYHYWLDTIEELLIEKGLISQTELEQKSNELAKPVTP